MALAGDISKAYNSIKTGEVEHHVRRYWFRFSQNELGKVFGANCIMFGDRPAASLMTIAVERVCESYSEYQKLGLFPVESVEIDASKLKGDSYVDDIPTGGSQSDVNRMMSIKDINSGQYIGTISRLLDNVGLSLKILVQSRSTDIESNAQLSGNALGYLWEPSTDVMGVKPKINPSKKRKGVKSKADLTLSDLENFKVSSLT